MKAFLKATVVGGVLFLLPVALVLFVLGYAVRLAKPVVEPVSDALHLDQLGHVAGIGAVSVLAVAALVLVSFAAGIVARTGLGASITGWLENSLLIGLPQYRLVKSMAEGLAHIETASGVKAALISIEGGWQMGYVLEALENGWLAVFLPQAPTPMSGNVMYLPAERVRMLAITMFQAMAVVKGAGVGSGAALRGVDLTPPPGQ